MRHCSKRAACASICRYLSDIAPACRGVLDKWFDRMPSQNDLLEAAWSLSGSKRRHPSHRIGKKRQSAWYSGRTDLLAAATTILSRHDCLLFCRLRRGVASSGWELHSTRADKALTSFAQSGSQVVFSTITRCIPQVRRVLGGPSVTSADPRARPHSA